jgi:hypothetical protein
MISSSIFHLGMRRSDLSLIGDWGEIYRNKDGMWRKSIFRAAHILKGRIFEPAWLAAASGSTTRMYRSPNTILLPNASPPQPEPAQPFGRYHPREELGEAGTTGMARLFGGQSALRPQFSYANFTGMESLGHRQSR